mgnify:CR=1 FL=1
MKMKLYEAYHCGGSALGKFYDTCITKAAKKFMATLDRPAVIDELESRQSAKIRYTDNHSIMRDFEIREV